MWETLTKKQLKKPKQKHIVFALCTLNVNSLCRNEIFKWTALLCEEGGAGFRRRAPAVYVSSFDPGVCPRGSRAPSGLGLTCSQQNRAACLAPPRTLTPACRLRSRLCSRPPSAPWGPRDSVGVCHLLRCCPPRARAGVPARSEGQCRHMCLPPYPAVPTPLRPSRRHCKLSLKLWTASLKRYGRPLCALGGPVSAVPGGACSLMLPWKPRGREAGLGKLL